MSGDANVMAPIGAMNSSRQPMSSTIPPRYPADQPTPETQPVRPGGASR